jgi:hypothetical protein
MWRFKENEEKMNTSAWLRLALYSLHQNYQQTTAFLGEANTE